MLIEVTHLSLVYPTGTVPALYDLNFEVGEGTLLSILGPSGCGKTTALRAIAGFERPQRGEIRIGGRTVCSPSNGCRLNIEGWGWCFRTTLCFLI